MSVIFLAKAHSSVRRDAPVFVDKLARRPRQLCVPISLSCILFNRVTQQPSLVPSCRWRGGENPGWFQRCAFVWGTAGGTEGGGRKEKVARLQATWERERENEEEEEEAEAELKKGKMKMFDAMSTIEIISNSEYNAHITLCFISFKSVLMLA